MKCKSNQRGGTMAFKKTITDGLLIVKTTTDRATVEISGNFKDEIIQEIEDGSTKIIVDLSSAEYVDSSFLGALVALLKRTTLKNGDLKLIGLQPAVRAMFDLTRLHRIFDIFDNIESAKKSF